MITFAARLKRGMCVLVEGFPYVVIYSGHVKYGKGPAFVRVEARDVSSGVMRKFQFNPLERLEVKELLIRWARYLHGNDGDRVFSDLETGEQVAVPDCFFGGDERRLEEGGSWRLVYLDGELFAAIPEFRA